MKTIQALVAVGGSASRLKSGGVSVPLSKSFMQMAGKPLLYWCLLSLYQAGVRKLVITGDKPIYLKEAQQVIGDLP